jgi:putative transcriptional regulator
MVMPVEPNGAMRSYAGQILLAMPDMPDPNFRQAAIALCVHDADGAMGIDVGSTIDGLDLRGLIESFGIDAGAVPDIPVLRGGPVEPRRGFVLHSLDWQGEDMLYVGDRWGLSGSIDILRDIAEGRGPRHFAAALGYAGWGAGQLDGELCRPGWFVGAVDHDMLFATPPELRWARGFSYNGIDPHHIIAQSGHA